MQWEDWFAEGVDPFAPHNDGERSGTVHLLRHGVDIGQAMKTGALWWRVDGEDKDFANPTAALNWAEAYLHRYIVVCSLCSGLRVRGTSAPRRIAHHLPCTPGVSRII